MSDLSPSSSDDDDDDDAPLLPPPPSSTSGDHAVRSGSSGRSGSNPRTTVGGITTSRPSTSPSLSPSAQLHAHVHVAGRQQQQRQRVSPAPTRLSSPPLTRLAEHAPATPAAGSSGIGVGIGIGIGVRSPATPVLAPDIDSSTTPPPSSYTYHDLATRPRSNPRTRTPRRNESPLSPEFRRDAAAAPLSRPSGAAAAGAAAASTAGGGGGVIRIGAGAAVGTTGPAATARSLRRIGTAEQQSTSASPARTRSTKQGPSKRKIRRWNNDRFVGVASDLAVSASNRSAADAFLRGEAEAAGYLRPNCPLRYRSAFDSLTRNYVDDEEEEDDEGEALDADATGRRLGKRRNDLAAVRDRFVRGEQAAAAPARTDQGETTGRMMEEIFTDGRRMFRWIEPRMRDVVVRAVARSPFAVRVLDAFELFLVDVSGGKKMSTTDRRAHVDATLDEVLFRPPTVTAKSSTTKVAPPSTTKSAIRIIPVVVHFHFNPDSSKGGFHRLLLHAVCQFHGLQASSRTVRLPAETADDMQKGHLARLLTVTGTCKGRGFRLVDHAKGEGDVAAGPAPDRKGTVQSLPAASSDAASGMRPMVDQILEPLSTLRVS